MDWAEMMPFIMQAVGGVIGGNIVGALTRGGGGVIGRTILGAIGGVAAGYGAPLIVPGDVLESASSLIDGENGRHLGNLIVGSAGGGIVGLVTGLLIRPGL